jgi:hypothetical protein
MVYKVEKRRLEPLRYKNIWSGGRRAARGETMNTGVVEVDLFSEEVDSPSHPEAVKFKRLLSRVAREYRCKLTSFDVSRGTVSFSFDNDELIAEILKVLGSEG